MDTPDSLISSIIAHWKSKYAVPSLFAEFLALNWLQEDANRLSPGELREILLEVRTNQNSAERRFRVP
jgi:hypothetical protein